MRKPVCLLLIPLMLLASVLLSACDEEKQQIVIVTRTLKKERLTSTAVPDEFSSLAPASSGTSYWVEGSVKNEGIENVENVEITFRCTEGIDDRVLIAMVKSIPPGKTVSFRTKPFTSKYEVKLVDETPQIVVGK